MGCAVGVARRRVDLHRDEGVAELAAQRLEALGEAEGVVAEAQPEQTGARRRALLHPGEIGVGDPDVGLALLAQGERERRLAEDGGQDHVVDHHRQGEAAGEAHPHDAHTRSTTALVLGRGQRAQPHSDRARLLQGEAGELLRDAGGPERLEGVAGGHRPPGIAEEVRQHRGAPGRRHAAAELGHLGRDARDLADDDDGGTAPDAVHVAPLATGLEEVLGEALERASRLACSTRRHGRTVASSVVSRTLQPLGARLPVLVGLGAVHDAAPVAELMTAAVRAAALDAGAPGLLGAIDCLMVPQGSWSLTDPARTVARRLGAASAHTVRCELGVSQQEVINHALAAVADGTHGVVVVAGAEARAWARGGGVEQDEESRSPDEVRTRPPDFVAPVELAAGIVLPPVQQYALIENALGAVERQPVDAAA